MIQVQGAIQVVPQSVSTESGTLRVDDGQTRPAVVQTLVTLNGPVQVIYPSEYVDEVIRGLQTAKEDSMTKAPPSDLYIPSSMNEVEKMAQAQEAIVKEDEHENPARRKVQ